MEVMKVVNLTKRFGGLVAVNNVDLTLEENEIFGLIGPNGAGKTTLFNCIASTFPVSSGKIYFEGQDITNFPTYKVCRLGIARTFQVVQTYRQMTALENVMVGAFTKEIKPVKARKKAEEILEITGLIEKKDQLGSELTIADLKRLEISRALATEPKVLLLDEAMAGLNLVEVKSAIELVRGLKARGLTLLVIEHVMEALMPIADRIAVLDAGSKIAEGLPEEIVNNEQVIKAYFGEGYHARSKGA
jgi:branched-chain amino acid transport system ATP-binding protein